MCAYRILKCGWVGAIQRLVFGMVLQGDLPGDVLIPPASALCGWTGVLPLSFSLSPPSFKPKTSTQPERLLTGVGVSARYIRCNTYDKRASSLSLNGQFTQGSRIEPSDARQTLVSS